MEEPNKQYFGMVLAKTIEDHELMMEAIGFLLANKNWTLRTGGDLGVNNPFERGALSRSKSSIIEKIDFNNPSVKVTSYCSKMFGKAFFDFSDGKQKYISNFVANILGKNCDNPVKFVMVASNNRKNVLDVEKICKKHAIDYYDLCIKEHCKIVQDKIDTMVKGYREK